ncbi:MAG: GtrA family protein [Oscillospiraceae bacterium]|nr:GtrA family protein [Oscillospiraceae bacterium]
MKERIKSLFDAKLWKFLLVGVLNTIVGNGLMFLLYNLAHWGYWPSTAVSYILASVMSYFLNRYFTFKYQGSGWKVVFRFALNIAVCYLLAYGIAQPLMKWLLSGATESVRDNVAMLTGMCLFVGFNYLGQRFFAFREEKEPPQEKEAE